VIIMGKTVCVGCLQNYPSKKYPIRGRATNGKCSDCGRETIVYAI